MAEEVTIKPHSESTSAAESENPITCSVKVFPTNVCALGLGVSFFLPWVHFWLGTPSGFDLQKFGGWYLFLWSIPIFCAAVIVFGFSKLSQKIVGLLTGLLPFGVGLYWYCEIGKELLPNLQYGAILSLIFGLGLMALPQIKE